MKLSNHPQDIIKDYCHTDVSFDTIGLGARSRKFCFISPKALAKLCIGIRTFSDPSDSIFIDNEHQLIAGLHEYLALKLIRMHPADRKHYYDEICRNVGYEATGSDIYRIESARVDDLRGGIITVKRLYINAKKEKEAALDIELMLNKHKSTYSLEDYRVMWDEYSKFNYVYTPHRLKLGESSVVKKISTVIQKSERTVRRAIAEILEADSKKDERKGASGPRANEKEFPDEVERRLVYFHKLKDTLFNLENQLPPLDHDESTFHEVPLTRTQTVALKSAFDGFYRKLDKYIQNHERIQKRFN